MAKSPCPADRVSAQPCIHVPAPDWRDQIIYFLLIDRFADGDPSNNDQGAGEFDPTNNAKYSGGDLKGIEQHLDYIKGLGATAGWITPPVANQWWNERVHYGGYHGYWAENFMKVDPHYGSLRDYQRLARKLHAAGMYLVQDIVTNHTADFFSYGRGWSKADPAADFVLTADSRGRTAPSQSPFDKNDPRNPRHRRAGIYHWTPEVTDYRDPARQFDFQVSGLDDLNTENPRVRDVLRRSYGYWIKKAGVDAFRIDTAFYVPPEFFADFLYSPDARYPGIVQVAKQTGREGFFAFGEGFGLDKPYDDTQAKRIEHYMAGPEGLPGMLNFPLYGTIADVFARGHPSAELGYRIRRMMEVHRNPWLMPTFIDNHDVDRFLAGGGIAGLRQSLLLIMTLPGIPVLYYGTEQGFSQQRAAMFKTGFGSGGKDHFSAATPLYRFVQRATALRRAHPLFSRGTPSILSTNAAAPGALAYRMTHENASALVVFNSSDSETLLDNLPAGLAPGTVLKGLFGIDSLPADIVVGAGGEVTVKLPPRAGWVWEITPEIAALPASRTSLTLEPLAETAVQGDFRVQGKAKGLPSFQLVVDGQLATAQTVVPKADGQWTANIDTGDMYDAALPHSLVAWSESPAAVSARQAFHVSRAWERLAEVADPVGDDSGPQGHYRYPNTPEWRENRPLDIREIRALRSGNTLKIEIAMNQVLATWNPPNGFDHVAFTVFFEIPGKGNGAKVMPLQNARLPAGMQWHYRLRAHGWSNALFSASGASTTNEGTPVAPGAILDIDLNRRSVTFTLPRAAFGPIESWSGVKLYVATWDYDGGYYKPLTESSTESFSGGNGAVDPLVMDDTGVIVLP